MCTQGNDSDNNLFARFGQLMTKTDSYELIPHQDEAIVINYDIYQKVWEEASVLRKSGALLNIARKISCPVLAIHGEFDPHPSAGVKEPLSHVLNDFNFIELEKCGHVPWLEKNARAAFFNILFNQIL